jgi:hypothetical protein
MEVNQQSRKTRATNSRARGSPANSHNSGTSTSTTSSTRSRLATWIVAQLAEDIEAACGLGNLDKKGRSSLSELCDYRSYILEQPECYGLKASDQRRRISQKVRRWKTLSRDKYLHILGKLDVLPFEERQGTKGTQARRTVDTDNIDSSLQGLESLSIKAGSRDQQEISDLEEEEFNEPPPKTRKPRYTVQELPPRAVIMSSSSSNRVVKMDSHSGGNGLLLLAQSQSFVIIGDMSLKLSFFYCQYPDLQGI